MKVLVTGASGLIGRPLTAALASSNPATAFDPQAVRERYLEHVKQLGDFYRKGLSDSGIDYQLINTQQPYDQALSAYGYDVLEES